MQNLIHRISTLKSIVVSIELILCLLCLRLIALGVRKIYEDSKLITELCVSHIKIKKANVAGSHPQISRDFITIKSLACFMTLEFLPLRCSLCILNYINFTPSDEDFCIVWIV